MIVLFATTNTRRCELVQQRTSWIGIPATVYPLSTTVHCELVSPGISSPSPSSPLAQRHDLPCSRPSSHQRSCIAVQNQVPRPLPTPAPPSAIVASSSSSRAHSPLCTRRPLQSPIPSCPSPLPSPEPEPFPHS
ncbi:hypothetical protein K466DRAFT_116495 [Polyporus arcularius HHB13444]|uniref:Uncharacterized protein n=1 Tax=Polyporus arcularius HHB13444 TaxID=1314778 RepID=A0A5C3NL81_9APHY|nr:hypothetical protein K466DRAFT_116495 [Polyporus arcularius HHB13444]